MKSLKRVFIGSFVLVMMLVALGVDEAHGFTVIVDAKSNIYGAGHAAAPAPGGGGGGILPVEVALSDGTDRVLTCHAITGKTRCNPDAALVSPDGGNCFALSSTNISSHDGISGIVADSTMFLAGVFVGPAEPANPPPANLNFTGTSNFSSISPLLNQVFFMGDGGTGTGTGALQEFQVPDGATRLFLGFVDGINLTGAPGFYDDNSGSLRVICGASVAVPVTSMSVSMAMAVLLVAAGSAMLVRRQRA